VREESAQRLPRNRSISFSMSASVIGREKNVFQAWNARPIPQPPSTQPGQKEPLPPTAQMPIRAVFTITYETKVLPELPLLLHPLHREGTEFFVGHAHETLPLLVHRLRACCASRCAGSALGPASVGTICKRPFFGQGDLNPPFARNFGRLFGAVAPVSPCSVQVMGGGLRAPEDMVARTKEGAAAAQGNNRSSARRLLERL
jgi:hypothetical protein